MIGLPVDSDGSGEPSYVVEHSNLVSIPRSHKTIRMTLAFHLPGSLDSWLRRRDARWKLATFVPACVLIGFLQSPTTAALGFAATLVFALLAKDRLRRLTRTLLPVSLYFLVFFAATLFFVDPGETPWTWSVFRLSPKAIAWCGLVFARTLAIATLILTLLETTPMPELAHGASALGAPAVLVRIVLLAQRYLFLLAEEFGRLRIALRVRGYRNRPTRHAYRTIGQVAGTLLVRGHERAERVGHAMVCRGGEGGAFRTLRANSTALADIALFIAVVAAAGGLFAWDRGWP